MLKLSKVKFFTTLLTSIVLAVSLFGFLFCINTNKDNRGSMLSAPHSMANGLNKFFCPISLAEHISKWQNTFVAVAGDTVSLAIYLLAVLSVCSIVFVTNFSWQICLCYYRRYYQYKLHNYLSLILAQGILQPKICA